MEETVKEAQDITNEIEKNTDSEGNIIEKALSKIKRWNFRIVGKRGRTFKSIY